MKASELRIGNLVFDDDGILSRVTGFKPYDYSVRCDEEEGCQLLVDLHPQDGRIRRDYELDTNFANPIPLKEEWLLKFGFKAESNYSNFKFKYLEIASSIRVISTNKRSNLNISHYT
jgi:hypothetical protein